MEQKIVWFQRVRILYKHFIRIFNQHFLVQGLEEDYPAILNSALATRGLLLEEFPTSCYKDILSTSAGIE